VYAGKQRHLFGIVLVRKDFLKTRRPHRKLVDSKFLARGYRLDEKKDGVS